MLEQQLNELNIFALRNLARRTGVVSPTSKKKDELIKNIIEIIASGKKPEKSKNRQGRPPKEFGFDVDAFNFTNNQNYALNQDVKKFENQDIKTVVGYVEYGNSNSAILWVYNNNNYENYFVPSAVVLNCGILTGDKVVAEVLLDESQKVVKNVFNINDCPILNFSKDRVCYNEVEHALPTKPLIFNKNEYTKLNLKKGENAYLYGFNNNDNTIAVVDMLNSCKTENKIYINISLADKNKLYLSSLKNVEMFTASITESADYSRRVVLLAIERVKRILEMGEEVVVVVDDMLSINGIDSDEMLIKKLASLAKNGNNGGNISMFAVMPNESMTQIEKLADIRLKIEDKNIFKK